MDFRSFAWQWGLPFANCPLKRQLRHHSGTNPLKSVLSVRLYNLMWLGPMATQGSLRISEKEALDFLSCLFGPIMLAKGYPSGDTTCGRGAMRKSRTLAMVLSMALQRTTSGATTAPSIMPNTCKLCLG